MLVVCALLVACCLCPFNPSTPVKLKSKAVLQTDTLYSCLLALVSHTHTPIVVYIYICFIATENSSVFNLCCTELTQHNHIHSIRWPFTHPFACKHIHIQLIIRSYRRHMLSYHYMNTALRRLTATCKVQALRWFELCYLAYNNNNTYIFYRAIPSWVSSAGLFTYMYVIYTDYSY